MRVSCFLFALLLSTAYNRAEDVKSNALDAFAEGCDDKDASLSCQAARIARNVMQHVGKSRSADADSLKIIDGVELVKAQQRAGETAARSLNDGTLFGKFAEYLQGHEIRVKLPELIGKNEMKGAFAETLRSFNKQSELVETGRKGGGKKGDGGVLLMGLMMAKTLAAIGFGGLGLLTMKALMVSGMALMLSAIIGVKKLASSGGDDHGGHQVHYVSAHDHHRRRRSMGDVGGPQQAAAASPYAGWTDYMTSN